MLLLLGVHPAMRLSDVAHTLEVAVCIAGQMQIHPTPTDQVPDIVAISAAFS